MPFKPVEHPKCPKCGKSVYAAEERVAGGLKWHKMCFKCGLCSKLLDSTNCSEHEGELFCKVCHARKFGPKGYGFGGGAGCLSMDQGEHLQRDGEYRGSNAVMEPRAIAKAPDGEGCPRCGGYVYAAEQMLARGRGYHKACFKCKICGRSLDSTLHCDGPDGDVYCRACYPKQFGPRGIGHAGVLWIGLQSDIEDNGDAAPKTTVIDTAAIQAPPGKGCPRCGGVVFAAEQVLAKSREWHRKCFKCRDCTKTLDSIIACDGPDKDVYCKTCYGKKWGPHGYGFACGSGFLQTDGLTEDQISQSRPFYNPDTTSIKAPAGQGCPRCGGMVFAAEQQLAKGTMWHKKCFNCAECHRPLDSMLACDGPDKEIHCRACYGKLFGPKGFGFGHTPTLVSTDSEHAPSYIDSKPQVGARSTDGHGCARCGYPVYAAEQMISKDRLWHKRCFSCGSCHRSLDSTNLNDAPDGDIYCRGCYGRNFGPRGVGFGLGAGTLSMA
ncbi:muscle LIM protein Mlp84B isoform X1 [Diachasmimorpha longicaudata]|uniref:muscle LIM protein Mlp84B isoform X1 n=1 Tax=Diachasmimorpha longicaudata TaxID=58733 RepID=UPI0030B8D43C